MKLYVALGGCRDVLKKIDAAADIDMIIVKPRRGLHKDAKVTFPVKNEIVEELPGIPALIDGTNIVVGDAIVEYLASNPLTASFLV